MISISRIRTYMFCPLKLYLQYNLKEDEEENEIFINKHIKDLRIDLQDITQRNIRKIKKNMELEEIESKLAIQTEDYIDTTFDILVEYKEEKLEEKIAKKNKSIENKSLEYKNLKNNNLENMNINSNPDSPQYNKINKDDENLIYTKHNEELEKLKEMKEDLIKETQFNILLLALKSKKGMNLLDKNGDEISEMFFPTCMYSYLIRDISLDLIGNVDKIEIINGNYIPILLRQNNPPLKGTWDSDTIEIVANAILIEQEFNTYVGAGFVDYLKLGERRLVLIDQEQRKSFFRILSQMNDIIEKGIVPKVKPNLKKCENCDYLEICENSKN